MKIPIIKSDKNKKSLKIKKFLINKLKKNKLINKNLIIVIGGDGFMLNTLKKLQKNKNINNIFFYGINSGTYGFLMNKFIPNKIINNIKKSKKISIHPLEMIAVNKNNISKKFLAINEVSVLRQSKQAANLRIMKNKKVIIKKLVSDGVLVCSPAGSTAYNLSVHGPILPLESNRLSVSPISPFRPRRWKGKVVNDKCIIKINNIDIKKRPVSAVADNYEIRNVKNITVKMNKNIFFNLLYDKQQSLQKKIKLEQLKKDFY